MNVIFDVKRRTSCGRFGIAVFAICGVSAVLAQTVSLHSARPDALLAVDMNRSTLVEKIVNAWGGEIPAVQSASFKNKLMGLRADHLLAANASGSLEGVLEVLYATEPKQLNTSLGGLPTGEADQADHAKVLGDAGIDLVYTPIAPCRVFDTRTPNTPFVASGLTSGITQTFDIDGTNLSAQGGSATGCNIPTTARAVVLAFSPVSPPTTGWFVGAANDGSPLPASTLFNYSSALTLTTFTVVIPMLGGFGGDIRLQARGVSAYSMDGVGDVTGYFLPVTRGNITNTIAGDSVFRVTNTSSASESTALRGQSTSTTSGGIGVWGSHAGSGFGVLGTASASGYGVYGSADTNGFGVFGSAPTGTGAAVFSNGDLKVATFGALSFGSLSRQMINLFGSTYGIGVQASTLYQRSGDFFVWHRGGSHVDGTGDPGPGGVVQMTLRPTAVAGTTANGHLYANTFHTTSDRNVKSQIVAIQPRAILSKVVAMPISSWVFNSDKSARHIGPMAQDFHKAFGLGGSDDKTIAMVDVDGVALAAIQGLNQKLVEQGKEKDAMLSTLKRANETMQRELAAIKKKLGM
jgi:hypothetical protein